jgi:hypothetical protein
MHGLFAELQRQAPMVKSVVAVKHPLCEVGFLGASNTGSGSEVARPPATLPGK